MLKEQKGAVAVIIAIAIAVLIGFVALVVDVGAMYEERRQNQTVADAAALAGAQELPDNPAAAVSKAIEYAGLNHRAVTESAVQIFATYIPNDTIRVTLKTTVNFSFAQVLGFSSGDVPATATAVVGSPSSFGGPRLLPWARMEKDPPHDGEPDFKFGKDFELFRSKDPATGNFQAIQLPWGYPHDATTKSFNGENDYRALVAGQDKNGQPVEAKPVQLHQILDTFTGNFGVNTSKALDTRISGCPLTFSEVVQSDPTGDLILNWKCPRLVVIVSVVNPEGTYGTLPDLLEHGNDSVFWPTGQAGPVEVESFNLFFITSYVSHPNEGDYVWGRFVKTLTAEEANLGAYDPSSGIKIVKLIQ